jgi:hypothetical protein
MLLQAAKYIGAGLATIGLAGAGVGIGTGASEKSIPFIVFLSIKLTRIFDPKYFTINIWLQLHNILSIEVKTLLYNI